VADSLLQVVFELVEHGVGLESTSIVNETSAVRGNVLSSRFKLNGRGAAKDGFEFAVMLVLAGQFSKSVASQREAKGKQLPFVRTEDPVNVVYYFPYVIHRTSLWDLGTTEIRHALHSSLAHDHC